MEIRDNSIHLMNMNPKLSRAVQEIGSATLQNYVRLINEWFKHDLSRYNFYLMPLAFFKEHDTATVVDLTAGQMNIAKYIADLYEKGNGHSNENEYAITLEFDIKLKKSTLPTAARLALSDNPDAIPITLTEEDIRKQYPWSYKELTERLSKRYTDFKQNKQFSFY